MFIKKKVYMELVDENERLKETIRSCAQEPSVSQASTIGTCLALDELKRQKKALEEKIKEVSEENSELKEEIANLKGEKRKAGMFCRGCKHFIVSPMIVEDGYVAMLDKKAYECALNRTCKDFEKGDSDGNSGD
jgi:hypothetical protein